MNWRGKQLRVWPRCKDGHRKEGKVVVGKSVADYLSGASVGGGGDQKDES